MWRSGAGGGQLALVHLLHGRAPSAGRGVQAVGVQHLQQQVVERHHVLALHAVQMLHAFVTAGRGGGHKEDGFRASPVQARGTASEGEVRVTPKTPACAPFSLFKEPFQDSLCRWLPCPLLALHLERERRRDSCVGGSFLKCGEQFKNVPCFRLSRCLPFNQKKNLNFFPCVTRSNWWASVDLWELLLPFSPSSCSSVVLASVLERKPKLSFLRKSLKKLSSWLPDTGVCPCCLLCLGALSPNCQMPPPLKGLWLP